jgi:hypothetical protein
MSVPKHRYDRGARCRYHQHRAAAGGDVFIIEIDADHGIGAQLRAPRPAFRKRDFPRFAQRFLVGARTSADDVANAGEDIAEDVGAENRLSGDDTLVLDDLAAFDRVGG